jgi:hypothetical protein
MCSSSFITKKQTAMTDAEMTPNPMHDAEVDAQVDALYRMVKGHINWDNLVPTALEIAQELEGMTQLKGAQRLELLQKTLRFAVADAKDLPDDKKEGILLFVNSVLPVVMQAAVLASKVPIKAIAHSCWSCCCVSRKK